MKWGWKCAAKVVLVLLAIVVLGSVVMSLWNWVMPALFVGAKTIDFAHALGLLVLSRILFGGFRGKGHGGRHRRGWRRWERMTPDERARFRERMHPSAGTSSDADTENRS